MKWDDFLLHQSCRSTMKVNGKLRGDEFAERNLTHFGGRELDRSRGDQFDSLFLRELRDPPVLDPSAFPQYLPRAGEKQSRDLTLSLRRMISGEGGESPNTREGRDCLLECLGETMQLQETFQNRRMPQVIGSQAPSNLC